VKKIMVLLLTLFLVSCQESKPTPEVTVDKIHCIHGCVRNFTYNLEEIAGDAVKDLRALCTSKYEKTECCKSSSGYYRECNI
jgi:hypothetical protein